MANPVTPDGKDTEFQVQVSLQARFPGGHEARCFIDAFNEWAGSEDIDALFSRVAHPLAGQGDVPVDATESAYGITTIYDPDYVAE